MKYSTCGSHLKNYRGTGLVLWARHPLGWA